MLSDRSEREAPEHAPGLGAPAARAHIASVLQTRGGRVDAERIAIAPSVASIWLALGYVLADLGDEMLVSARAADDVTHAFDVSGLVSTSLALAADEGAALFEAASERSRGVALVGDEASEEIVALLAELDLPSLVDERRATRTTVSAWPIFAGADAPLALAVGEHEGVAWLAVAGPADRAEPLLARLERHAPVFFPTTR